MNGLISCRRSAGQSGVSPNCLPSASECMLRPFSLSEQGDLFWVLPLTLLLQPLQPACSCGCLWRVHSACSRLPSALVLQLLTLLSVLVSLVGQRMTSWQRFDSFRARWHSLMRAMRGQVQRKTEGFLQRLCSVAQGHDTTVLRGY